MMAPNLQPNRLMLAQVRKAIAIEIDQSPDLMVIPRAVMISDGFGGMVPDLFGSTTDVSVPVRLSHERNGVNPVQVFPAGLDTSLSLFAMWKHTAEIREGEVGTARGRQFKVGPVDPLEKFGGVQAYQAPLIPAGDVPSGLVTGVSLNGTDPEALTIASTFQLIATIAPESAANQTVAWTSDNVLVATVNSSGLVTAIGAGTAHVTVTTESGAFTAVREFEVAA